MWYYSVVRQKLAVVLFVGRQLVKRGACRDNVGLVDRDSCVYQRGHLRDPAISLHCVASVASRLWGRSESSSEWGSMLVLWGNLAVCRKAAAYV